MYIYFFVGAGNTLAEIAGEKAGIFKVLDPKWKILQRSCILGCAFN